MSEENGDNYKPMSDEQRQRTMDFILEHQAKFFADIEALKEAIAAKNETFDREHEKAMRRLERLERVLTLALVTGRRVRSDFRTSQNNIQSLFESSREQNEKINMLIEMRLSAQGEINKLFEGQAELQKGQAEFQKRQAELQEKQVEFQRGQVELQKGQVELQERQAKLQEGQVEFQKGYAELQKGQVELQKRQIELQVGMNEFREEIRGVIKEMARAITSTNQRIDKLENKGDNSEN